MDKETKNSYEEENGGERGDYDGDDTIASPDNLGLGCVSIHVEPSISKLSGTTDEPPPHLPAIKN